MAHRRQSTTAINKRIYIKTVRLWQTIYKQFELIHTRVCYPYMGVHHYLYMGKEVQVVLVNHVTDVRIARTVLLSSTTYKAYLSSTDYKKDQQLKKRLDISSIMHVLEIPIY